MTGPTPVAPLSYAPALPRRGHVVGVLALAVAVLGLSVPAYMAYQIFTGERRTFGVYRAYVSQSFKVAGWRMDLYANGPWYAIDCVAILLGLIGLYRGRSGFAVAAVVIAAVSMTGKLTIVLGSPW